MTPNFWRSKCRLLFFTHGNCSRVIGLWSSSGLVVFFCIIIKVRCHHQRCTAPAAAWIPAYVWETPPESPQAIRRSIDLSGGFLLWATHLGGADQCFGDLRLSGRVKIGARRGKLRRPHPPAYFRLIAFFDVIPLFFAFSAFFAYFLLLLKINRFFQLLNCYVKKRWPQKFQAKE